ncbi:carboxypeptidase regulatory-like domain-containing protein [Rugosimonospora africana]|uniref:carboxypeptidase regulatory-like domain-containing protein n=1 Tax=Rugosimonospora africana TaxID=556532 RepID=UPI001EF1CF86|nr:carboxypeptidase regulatory-like domain-containing protein [Rugosimonospora africana]
MLAAAAALAIAVFGLPGAGQAAAGGGTGKSTKPNVQALCPAPEKGEATCFAMRRLDAKHAKGIQPAVTPDGFGPADLASAYQLPAGGGAGATVAIVDAFDNPNAEADLAVYRAQYGLPACTTANGCFRKVDQRGGTNYPPGDIGWGGEITLDLDMVSAVAPAAHILLVEADDNQDINLADGVDEAVALGAKYVSNSYGTGYTSTPGSGEDPSDPTVMDPHYNHPGVAVVASTGDDDYGVSYPAASPYVTAVGGTSLVRDSSARGWSETVWHNSHGGPGSGCSLYEPKPAFQHDTGCAKRTEADVSAVSDPETGVAVYDTYGDSGWDIFGGTSAASPIIAGVYAVAGTPVAGSYPNSYPYLTPSALNDVTTGSNGTCSPTYLCTAGAGYDGPTGLGTPKGITAFATTPHGDIVGTVTDAATGAPVAGAAVSTSAGTASTDAAGHYDIVVPVGSYTLTVSAYGYSTSTVTGVAVADGATVTENVSLTAIPSSTVTGTVTDGSGHGWPLYAKITVDGVPGGPVFTDPYTGHYSIQLPQGQTYHLNVTANYPGYSGVTHDVTVGAGDVVANVAVPVDSASCNAPGYQPSFTGTTQTFDTTSTPAGWTVSNATANGGWEFDDPEPRGNNTGGTGHFAIVDSDYLGSGKAEDTTLTTPVTDFSGSASGAPDVSFDTDYKSFTNGYANVDVTVDGGATWTNLWHHTNDSVTGPAHVDIPLPQAAGKSAVQVRFHYAGTWAYWWEVDDVFLGARSCDPVHGGLVLGQVTDANTKAGILGATVSTSDSAAAHGTSAATPDDPNLGDGFYWLYSPVTGAHKFTAAKKSYTSLTKSVNVAANFTTKANFALTAGQLKVTPASIDKTLPWQGSATATLTVKNTGGQPATLNISEQAGGFQLLTQGGAPLNLVHTTVSRGSMAAAVKGMKAAGKAPADASPAAAPWTSIADYPVTIQDNLVGLFDGKLYSAFGYNGGDDLADLYAYDPDTGSWTKLASATDTREHPGGGFINGKLIAAGGWGISGAPDAKVEIYDPATNAWSTGANNPKPYSAAGSAVLGTKLYQVGGCSANACGNTDVEVYDTATNSWASAAAYPEATAWESCGGISGKVYCAGGTTDDASIKHAYVYDPAGDSWSPIADLPIDLWGSGTTTAGGKLLVSGGVTDDSATVTNQGYAYDPATGQWAALPNSNNSLYRGGSACGFYKIGGNPGGQFVPPVAKSEVLPGFVDCASGASDVSWLSANPTSLTLAAGASATVTVTLNAGVPDITQPGTFTAKLAFDSDTPYTLAPVDVTMTVNPPKTWGKIAGTVTSATGAPIAGATVQIDTWATSYTLKTDKNGQYALWLDVRNNPLQLIVAKDGFQPQVRTIKITKGVTTTADFSLKPA